MSAENHRARWAEVLVWTRWAEVLLRTRRAMLGQRANRAMDQQRALLRTKYGMGARRRRTEKLWTGRTKSLKRTGWRRERLCESRLLRESLSERGLLCEGLRET